MQLPNFITMLMVRVPSVCSEFVIVFSKRCVWAVFGCIALWKEQELIL